MLGRTPPNTTSFKIGTPGARLSNMRFTPLFAVVLASAACSTPPRAGGIDPILTTGTSEPGAFASRTRIEIVFPSVPIERIGCSAGSGQRVYYWMATANYPGSGYPNNHFQQVRVWFKLPQSIQVGSAQFDSAIAHQEIIVDEAGGEPPMRLNAVAADHARLLLQQVNGKRELRARIIVEGRNATRSMVATRDSVVMLGWCDSSKPYQYVIAPFRR